ncbi:unnamed protein product [Closterium sp. Naga37s-1]|nr:unnamed protein product [Closterium sp. Naga37s-1]
MRSGRIDRSCTSASSSIRRTMYRLAPLFRHLPLFPLAPLRICMLPRTAVAALSAPLLARRVPPLRHCQLHVVHPRLSAHRRPRTSAISAACRVLNALASLTPSLASPLTCSTRRLISSTSRFRAAMASPCFFTCASNSFARSFKPALISLISSEEERRGRKGFQGEDDRRRGGSVGVYEEWRGREGFQEEGFNREGLRRERFARSEGRGGREGFRRDDGDRLRGKGEGFRGQRDGLKGEDERFRGEEEGSRRQEGYGKREGRGSYGRASRQERQSDLSRFSGYGRKERAGRWEGAEREGSVEGAEREGRGDGEKRWGAGTRSVGEAEGGNWRGVEAGGGEGRGRSRESFGASEREASDTRGASAAGDAAGRGETDGGDLGEREWGRSEGGAKEWKLGERGAVEGGATERQSGKGHSENRQRESGGIAAGGGEEGGGSRGRGVAEEGVQQGGAEGGEGGVRGVAEVVMQQGGVDVMGWDDVFFADVGVTWQGLGMQEEVAEAMQRAGFERPSAIQAGAIPQILSGSDVVVAAETGSGKTHAYLAPVLSHVLTWREEERQREMAEREEERRSEESLGEEGEVGEVRRRRVGARKFALVLCPNAALCRQVMEMALSLRSPDNRPLLAVEAVVGGQAWPSTPPDVVVATPAALFNHLFAFDPKQRRRSAFVRDVALVVADEADMLLSGGYARIVGRLLGLFRLDEKERSEAARLAAGSASVARGFGAGESEEEGRGEDEEMHWTEMVPVVVQEQGEGGAQSAVAAAAAGDASSSASAAYQGKKKAVEGAEEGEGYGEADKEWSEGEEGGKHGEERAAVLDAAVRLGESERAAGRGGKVVVSVRESAREEGSRRAKWGRRRREYARSKQYVWVAATMPVGTKRSVGEVLAKQFPAAVWVSGGLLHRHNPLSVPITPLHTCTPTHTQRLVRHDWHQVDDSSRAAALLRALAGGNGQLEGGVESGANGVPSAEQHDSIQRTMVFANDVESVDAIGRLLQRHLSSAAATSAGGADDVAVGGAADVAAEKGADVAWCAVYHKDVPLDERERALRRFQEGGGVLVCTDAASRGIDVEHVSHVVQAEFALNAVDFLHRVGRTARAGRPGRVTSLYTAGSAPLAEAVRAAVQRRESTVSGGGGRGGV